MSLGSIRPRRTAWWSVLWAMPSAFTATGPPRSAAATTAAPALAHTAPVGHRHPVRAQQPLARSASLRTVVIAVSRRRGASTTGDSGSGVIRGPATGSAGGPPTPGRSWPRPRPPPWRPRAARAPPALAAPRRPPARRPGSPPSPRPARPARPPRRRPGRTRSTASAQSSSAQRSARGRSAKSRLQVRRAAHHGREGRRHRLRLAPDVGVVVERVGQRHPVAQHRAQLRALRRWSAPRTAPPRRRRRPRSAPPRPPSC